ncbi:CocE/NonD family hydrolase [Streptomyces griseorubiginosus]|uniref:CocE/NonD family hydrolase n=1 Tax=Streptomyces griseorubiginosus TaxID=67304 RepID=UPI001AD6F601|nr:CocE/NonD family hydrolase [Streptomyces griseorubiginosus]MBO4256973.1 CocE/NonD family hydrolase [Streptomyces griseorubiginosus]
MDKFIDELGLEVAFMPSPRPEKSQPPLPVPDPATLTLRKGSVNAEGAFPLLCDILFERDVTIALRDGSEVFGDVFRPVGEEGVPAILAYTHYGKRAGHGPWNANPPVRAFGATADQFSGLDSFEAPDPGYWVAHGYAVVNVDAVGTGYSDGEHAVFPGTKSGRDIYDVVEWIAQQGWCNGKVGMNGNSYLAANQWAAAAQQPPHLAAIAPWEGLSDFYRDTVFRGGIRNTGAFWADAIHATLFGQGLVEDAVGENADRYPFFNAYWADKVADFSKITIPAYVAASWTNPLHTPGTIRAYRELGSTEKWLRVHNSFEWLDIADQDSRDDLRKFFDRYLKGLENGWEDTPRVRLSILDQGGTDVVGRAESEWPLARQTWRSLALDATSGSLVDGAVAQEAALTYVGDDLGDSVEFSIEAIEELEINGYMKLHLWIEAAEADDADIFAAVYKKSADGTVLHHFTITDPGVRTFAETQVTDGVIDLPFAWAGPNGCIRASHRALDPARSTESEPVLLHQSEELLEPGVAVPVELSLWPSAFVVHPGEHLVVKIAGHPVGSVSTAGTPDPNMPTRNRGEYRIRTGGAFDSHLLLPVVS